MLFTAVAILALSINPPATTHCCSLKEREALNEDEEEWEEASDLEDLVQNARVQEGSNGLVISLDDAKGAIPSSHPHQGWQPQACSLQRLESKVAQEHCTSKEDDAVCMRLQKQNCQWFRNIRFK